jgi:hypothetical protein
MLEKLVNYQDLSPLLPKNDTLASMSEDDFEDAMDKWTESAQAAPYVKEVTWATSGKEDFDVATAETK